MNRIWFPRKASCFLGEAIIRFCTKQITGKEQNIVKIFVKMVFLKAAAILQWLEMAQQNFKLLSTYVGPRHILSRAP